MLVDQCDPAAYRIGIIRTESPNHKGKLKMEDLKAGRRLVRLELSLRALGMPENDLWMCTTRIRTRFQAGCSNCLEFMIEVAEVQAAHIGQRPE